MPLKWAVCWSNLFSVKTMNNQIIAVVNFILTVIGAFTFGYKATEYSMNEPIVPLVSLFALSEINSPPQKNIVISYYETLKYGHCKRPGWRPCQSAGESVFKLQVVRLEAVKYQCNVPNCFL